MNPQRFSEGEMIFLRALGALGGDDAARSGDDDDNRPHEEVEAMSNPQITITIEHEGTAVTIEPADPPPGAVEMHSAMPVALDFGKWARVAACVASCLVGTTREEAGAENVAASNNAKPNSAKPVK